MIMLVGMKARQLKTIVAWINEHLKKFGYRAELVRGYYNTDRHIKGTHCRRPGKTYYGNRLLVWLIEPDHAPYVADVWGGDLRGDRQRNWDLNKEILQFDHNSAVPYRRNDEVENWLSVELKKLGAA